MRWVLAVALVWCAADSRPASAAPRVYVNGAARCACAPVPDGCYTAKHCLDNLPPGAVVTLGSERVLAWSLDPDRDLAHMPYGADPEQVIGVPDVGAHAIWRGIRTGAAEMRRAHVHSGPIYRGQRLAVQAQTYDVWCHAKNGLVGGLPLPSWADVIRPGDSGAGFYVDGVLVGILSLNAPAGCGAWTVRVP